MVEFPRKSPFIPLFQRGRPNLLPLPKGGREGFEICSPWSDVSLYHASQLIDKDMGLAQGFGDSIAAAEGKHDFHAGLHIHPMSGRDINRFHSLTRSQDHADNSISHKQRNYSSANSVESVAILTAQPITGKTIWIIDDMIDTADSMCKLVRGLAPMKPRSINIAIVHPVFSPPAVQRLKELCDESLIGSILVTDTIPCTPEIREKLPCLQVIPSTTLAAEIVFRLNNELALSPLLATFNADDYLKK